MICLVNSPNIYYTHFPVVVYLGGLESIDLCFWVTLLSIADSSQLVGKIGSDSFPIFTHSTYASTAVENTKVNEQEKKKERDSDIW